MMFSSVLDFWFEETERKFHFNATPAFDSDIRKRFESLATDQAAIVQNSEEHPWLDEPQSALALVILLDQFPRNMYRGTPAAFAWDPLALKVAKSAIAKGFDLKTPLNRRAFFYMPFMHSENLGDQSECVKLVDQRLNDKNTLFHAEAHHKLIEKFDRFPHRNNILDRESTEAEINYLKDGGYTP